MSQRILAALAVLALTAGCGTSAKPAAEPSPPATEHAGHETPQAAPAARKLRAGEHRVDLRMPKAYTPSAPTGVGTDDYR
ncbi:hypothetical protein [Nocardioides marmoriginsengisoli]|uniref:hypothetical protein n=1 Tax=Nocardioides marmoriginsengisoli TaxID=661483 RepID=UPI0016190BD0|nr:hypothetical protein [Nocardioides marmoriginsengisoli]